MRKLCVACAMDLYTTLLALNPSFELPGELSDSLSGTSPVAMRVEVGRAFRAVVCLEPGGTSMRDLQRCCSKEGLRGVGLSCARGAAPQ